MGGHFPQSSLPVQCWSLNLSSINPSGIMQPTCWTLLKQVIKDSFEFFFVCFVFKFVMASNFSLVFFYTSIISLFLLWLYFAVPLLACSCVQSFDYCAHYCALKLAFKFFLLVILLKFHNDCAGTSVQPKKNMNMMVTFKNSLTDEKKKKKLQKNNL